MLRNVRWIWMIGLIMIVTGCWDRVEIEDRGFVVGTAIDSADGDTLLLTFQYGVPGKMQSNSQSEGKSGNPYVNVSMEAKTLFRAARKMSNIRSRSPYLVHNRVIVVSEKLAREGRLGEVLDLFIREPEMRRATKVMIAAGEAKGIMEVKPKMEKLPAQYIESAIGNLNKSESILPPTSIGLVHQYLLDEGSYAIPKVMIVKDNINISGAAVFNGHDQKMRGFLNSEETTGRNFITGHLSTGAFEVKLKGEYVVFELKNMDRRIEVNMADPEHPVFDIWIYAEGSIGESFYKESLMDENRIEKIEAEVRGDILRQTDAVLEKLQRVYKVDILGLGSHLRENEYKKWKKIKDNWDTGKNYFSQSQVRVHVKTRVRILGTVLKTERERE